MKTFAFISALWIGLGLICTTSVCAQGGSLKPSNAEIERLARGLEDKSAVVRNSSRQALLDTLSSGKEVPVNAQTKGLIEAEFLKDTNKQSILLAGLAGVESVSAKIHALAGMPIRNPQSGSFYGTNEWAANLVLARKGESASIHRLLDFAQTQDTHTQVVFVVVDLKFVPQPEVVHYLRHFVESDDRLEPVKETVRGIPVANYAASSLARLLQDFPVSYKEDYSYSEAEIKSARGWMAKQGNEWKFKP